MMGKAFSARAISSLTLSLLMAAMTAPIALAETQGSFERTLKVSGAVDLEIETGSGSVNVRTGGSNTVHVSGTIKASNWFGADPTEKIRRIEANPPIQQSGNDIRIGHLVDPELRRNISISYEVEVPPETRLRSHTGSGGQTIQGIRGPLDVQSGSGSLVVADIGDTVRAETGSGSVEANHIKGNVRARSGSGSIRATDVAGGLEGQTGSGNITLVQTSSGAVRVDTGSGTIDLRGIRGSLEAKAGSGSIEAEGAATGAWTVRTGSGSVRLRLPSDATFDLYAHTGSGSVSVGPPVTVQGTISRKEVRGKVRGGGVPIEVETGSGGIEVQ